ncbi:MAG: ATP-binding cassette domain-containing protein [Chloroflexi bacterium]|nr:MAG: ATP-binding cassette domain-containing protein [Chloroflexota bacterium]
MTMLRVRDVGMRFGGLVALQGVSLDLNRGEILGLIGPNGAGKTTLFNCISGLLNPTEGSIFFESRSLRFAPPHERARRGIARTFQNLQLWDSMTVLENLELPIDAAGNRNTLSDALGLPFSHYAERAAAERARAILHVLELDPFVNRLAGDLPAGIQRRVELGRAIAMRPKLVLLDEPAAGLDAGETEHLAELLRTVRERFHVSMLLVDHDMSLVMKVCDYIYVLDFGKVLARGKPAEVRNDSKVIAAYLGEASPELSESGAETVEEPTIIVRSSGPVHDGESAEAAATVVPAASSETESQVLAARGEPLLEVTGLAAGYGRLEVIRDIALNVHAGEVVACIGANGAGKTTTLRAISGVIHARSGRVRFAGRNITGSRPEAIARMGLAHIPEGRGLFPRLSVEDTLRLALDSTGSKAHIEAAYDVFPRLQQRRRQAVGTLSGGEQQMVAMARAILAQPRLLMLDEMSQGLAPTIVQQLFQMIHVFRDQGIAVLLVEQFVQSALQVADRAYIFEHGSIAHEASAAELRRDRNLISGSYLGSAAAGEETAIEVAANGNGHVVHPELMETVSMRMPAEIKRALEERAEREGRPAGAIALELLEEVKK